MFNHFVFKVVQFGFDQLSSYRPSVRPRCSPDINGLELNALSNSCLWKRNQQLKQLWLPPYPFRTDGCVFTAMRLCGSLSLGPINSYKESEGEKAVADRNVDRKETCISVCAQSDLNQSSWRGRLPPKLAVHCHAPQPWRRDKIAIAICCQLMDP